jgi:hypothetical protein
MLTKKMIATDAFAFIALSLSVVLLVSIMMNNVLSQGSANSQINIDTITISGSLAEKDLTQLILYSDIVVTGRVIEKSEAIKIRPVTGGDYSLFTDYYIKAIDVLKGENTFEINMQIPVRIQGGKTDNLEVIVEEAPELIIGEEYLLFLFRPGRGGGYNTEGNYFYITGAVQGIYSVVNHGETQFFISQMDNPELTIENVISRINENIHIEVKTKMEEFLENNLRNLESGFITEDEYYQFIEGANTFATIVD